MEIRSKKILGGILIFAISLRIILAIGSDNFNHPDENFQILEQAHRLVFGYSVIPWEFRHAMRSMILPGLIAGILYPFKILGIDSPDVYIPSLKIILSLISLIVVYMAFVIGKKLSSVRAGLIAAFFCAVWYDIIYFSIRPLGEVWATTFFITAIALVLNQKDKKLIILAGFFACLSVAIRINYFPAVFVFILYQIYQYRDHRVKLLLLSFFASLLVVGLFDKITLGQFYNSYINYYQMNADFFTGGHSFGERFGIEYILFFGLATFYLGWLFLISSGIYWKKTAPLLAIVVTILLTHFLLPAQQHLIDIRHIYLAFPLVLIIGAISINEIIKRRVTVNFHKIAYVGTVFLFLAISTTGALGKLPGQKLIFKNKTFDPSKTTIFYKRPQLLAYKYLHNDDNLYGVYDLSQKWFRSGAFYYLHRNVPLYFYDRPPANMAFVSHIIADFPLMNAPDFRLEKTIGDVNIYCRKDEHYRYVEDKNYNYNFLQPGVDLSIKESSN